MSNAYSSAGGRISTYLSPSVGVISRGATAGGIESPPCTPSMSSQRERRKSYSRVRVAMQWGWKTKNQSLRWSSTPTKSMSVTYICHGNRYNKAGFRDGHLEVQRTDSTAKITRPRCRCSKNPLPEERPEELINYYVKSTLAARNIASAAGFLALSWSTVVLLGGFVSVLQIKDFWPLSLLSFLMASKILLEMKVGTAWDYVADIHILRLIKGQNQLKWPNRMVPWMIIFGLVVKMILAICIALPIILVGQFLALGLSVARLVQRDYGDAGGDPANKGKLNAALIIFYVLVIFQSLSVLYWAFLGALEPSGLVNKQYGFGVWGPKIVSRYRTETSAKYRKDELLPKNWNLITFSVGLLEFASPDDCLWGARVLHTFIGKGIPIRQELLLSTQAIQNLIDMIGLPSKNNSEIRERAARIVADIASELRITQFSETLRCICRLLESCNQYTHPEVAHPSENSKQTLDRTAHLSLAITDQADHKQVSNLASAKLPEKRSWIQTKLGIEIYTENTGGGCDLEIYSRNVYFNFHVSKGTKELLSKYLVIHYYSYVSKGTKALLSQCLVILERLTQDKDNCIEMIKHQRLLSKITLPLSYHDLLNIVCDHTWVVRSLTVVSRLINVGSGEDTTMLRQDISRNTVAICNLMHILEVDNEGARELHGHAIEILTELAFDDSFKKLASDESTSMKEMFVKTLRRIFLEDKNGNAIVEKEDEEKDSRVRRKAREALVRLLRVPTATDNSVALTSSTNVDDIDLLPKQDMINLLTKVVNQILSSKGEHAADGVTLAGPSNGFHVEMIVERQPPNGSESDTRQPSIQETEEQSEDRKMLMSMLSLTMAICNKNVINGDDFTRAVPDDATLVKKLKEMVEMNKNATTDGWRILKLACQVVIAVVQLKPSCISEFNEHNFKEALSKALETMKDVDSCMLFPGDEREVPARSLTSLVKEAQKLLAQEQGDLSV